MTGVAAGLMVTVGIGFILSLASAPESLSRSNEELLIVANKGDHSISIVDPYAGRETDRIVVSGITGHEVAASPDGTMAVVPIYGNSGVGQPGTDGQSLDVIDLVSRRVLSTIQLPKPARPHCAAFGPDGMLYVTTELIDSITVVDPKTLRVTAAIPTGQHESHMMAITRDGKRAYTANVHSGTVSAIDLVSKKVIAVIPISRVAQRIALTPDDRFAFTADQTSPRLAVIDTSVNAIRSWISLPGIGYGTCATPDGRNLIVALVSINKVGIVDLQSMTLSSTVDVPKSPQEVLVRPDGRVAYISCDTSRQVVALTLSSLKLEKTIDVGPGADGLAWAGGRNQK